MLVRKNKVADELLQTSKYSRCIFFENYIYEYKKDKERVKDNG